MKQAAFSQFHRRPKVSADGGRYMGYSINTPEYHYVEWYTWNYKTKKRGEYISAELYDRKEDPNKTLNIASIDTSKEIVKQLSSQFEDGWKQAVPIVSN